MIISVEELKELIERDYGFKRELIQNPELCGLWHVRFQVNGIRYYGWTAHSGAVPQIKSEGCVTLRHDHMGVPVTEEYYNEHIKGHKTMLRHITDGESGDWEDTGMRFESQEEVEEFILSLPHPKEYFYAFVD